ncbi:hypothetical protein IKG13_02160 [Candidatus Saccharibacteria bacterium]|nr:hypothetical protein [Candidatus Saccharibacteria bacterium]MBR3378215.1 hypothetical protein [Candidatus Saccharibacteria bacterium]
MAKHKIFIGDYNVTKIRLGDSKSTDYSYDSHTQVLQIFWRGKEVSRRENVQPGEAFMVICDGSEPKLNVLHLPKHPNDFLMYILGFGNGLRCHNWNKFDKTLEEQRRIKLTKDRTEYHFSGDFYYFSFCEDKAGKPYHLAAIIEDDLDSEEYLEILSEWPYPIRYPRAFLRVAFKERFGISNRKIDKLFDEWDK